eukprot:TRINITY_DN47085_c0_g1_i1.p2 TRINITY_DN47085_c0_g1~~TRINITY_DN47085_c0_g1_i1.p2  ORF type:complete len:498 (+),score=177.26 TRINITY_DN47085_c0_g1_i1:75-1496(+)
MVRAATESRPRLLLRAVACTAALRHQQQQQGDGAALLDLLLLLGTAADQASRNDDLLDPELESWDHVLARWLEHDATSQSVGEAVQALSEGPATAAYGEAVMRCGLERMRAASRALATADEHLRPPDCGAAAEADLAAEVDKWEFLLMQRRTADTEVEEPAGAVAFLESVAALSAQRPAEQRPPHSAAPEDAAARADEKRFLQAVVDAVRKRRSAEQAEAERAQQLGASSEGGCEGGFVDIRPGSPKRALRQALDEHRRRKTLMADEMQRLASFKDFPVSSKSCSTRTLAAAGFFHTPLPGHPDGASCFSCGVWLCGWEPEDDPAELHAEMDRLQCNGCQYLKQLTEAGHTERPPSPLAIRSPPRAREGGQGAPEAAAAQSSKRLLSPFGTPGRQVIFDRQKMQALFKKYDRNENGFISMEEFKHLWTEWENYGIAQDERELERVFSQFDTSCVDGRLSLEEFSMLMLQRLKM